MKKNNQINTNNYINQFAFTLVELIVVITILAILMIVVFTSYQGYSEYTRDSVRLSDVKTLDVSLDLFITNNGNYPIPSNSIDILFSGGLAWSQGTIGDSVITNLTILNKKPLDPLYNNEYTYSITHKKNEYQIGYILENDELSFDFINNNTFASSNGISMLIGSYNGMILNVDTPIISYFLAIPSIITSIKGETNLQQIINNHGLVYPSYSNTPASYTLSAPNRTYSGGFDYSPNSLIVYSGSLLKNLEIHDVIDIFTLLKKAYVGTSLVTKFSDSAYNDSFIGLSNLMTEMLGVKSFKGKLPTNCREMFFLNNYYSFSSQMSTFDADGDGPLNSFGAYCLMDSNKEVFTLYPMESINALSASEMELKCNEVGLQLYVPRTKQHFEASLDKYGYSYFRLMGIYPSYGGLCQNLPLNYLGYDSSYNSCLSWLPKDKGRYYVSNLLTITEPNGDNSSDGSLGYNYNISTNRIINYNDISNSNINSSYIYGGINSNNAIGGYKNNKWVCSGKNESVVMFKNDLLQLQEPTLNILNLGNSNIYTSCRQIKLSGNSLGDGYYNIKPSTTSITVYCDMTSSGEAWSLYTVNGINSLHASEMESYCSNLGLQLFVPRTKEHFETATTKLGYYYFRIMGIYPVIKGNKCITEHMNFLGDLSTATNSMCTKWLPKDGGRYFIEDNLSISEPNGDNDLNGSMSYNFNITSNLVTSYNDIVNTNLGGIMGGMNINNSLGGYKTNRFICSHPDEKFPY